MLLVQDNGSVLFPLVHFVNGLDALVEEGDILDLLQHLLEIVSELLEAMGEVIVGDEYDSVQDSLPKHLRAAYHVPYQLILDGSLLLLEVRQHAIL